MVLHEDKAVLHRAREAMSDFLVTRLALRTNNKTADPPHLTGRGVGWGFGYGQPT